MIWRRAFSTAGAALMVVAVASPASAHPLGPPPEVTMEASGHQVRMTWQAERDDLFAVALSVGAVAGELVFEEVDGVVVQVGGERDDVLLAESPDIARYLTDELAVVQAGQPCTGTLEERPTYDGRPAELVFTCPRPVADVEVRITALTEISDAYRTIVRAPDADPARGLHTAAEPTMAYAFDPAAGARGRSRPLGSASAAATAAGGAAALVAGSLWLARWSRQRVSP